MLTRGKVSELQQKAFKSQSSTSQTEETKHSYSVIDFEQALELCQIYTSQNATDAFRRESDADLKRKLNVNYINQYVDEKKPIVAGYEDLNMLKQALTEEITHYGPITKALEDPTVDEVRGNGIAQLFVEKNGETIQLDAEFTDREHMERIITKLIGVSKARLTPKNPMVNARTIEGFRVNATHAEISPYLEPSFVIRKFSKRTVTPDAMIGNKSFSIGMFKLLSLIPKADLSWITVGPTGSGKTTLNEILVKEIDPLSRIITIENPSEMRLLRRENNLPYGKIINDVLQLESVADDDDSSPATMENLLINAMRQSPHWIGPGELRSPGEFATALRAAQTGHYFFTTLHAEGDKEAIYRFLTAYLMVSDEPAELALRNICSAVKFIIFQQKLADGSRKITSISEVLGSEGLSPIINQIYKFEFGDAIEDEKTHKVIKIVGKHKRVGCISEQTQEKMLTAGIKRSRFEYLTIEPSDSEEEMYQ